MLGHITVVSVWVYWVWDMLGHITVVFVLGMRHAVVWVYWV